MPRFIRNLLVSVRTAFAEAGRCWLLGLRDAFACGLWWRSALWCLAVTLLWVWLYVHFYREIMTLSGTIAVVAFLGMFLFTFMLTGSGSGGSVVAMGNIGAGLLPVAQLLLIATAVGALVYVLLFLVGLLGTARLPLSWLLLPRARRAVMRHYAAASLTAQLPTPPAFSMWRMLRSLLLVAVQLCVPVLAFLLLLKWAIRGNVSLLYRSAARHIVARPQRRALWCRQKSTVLALGILLLVQLLIPVLNLLLPAVMCTSVCHLQYRGLRAPA